MKEKKRNGFKTFSIIIIIVFFINMFNKLCCRIAVAGDYLSTRGKIYEWRFGKVFYSRMGQGSPLILLHELSPTGSGYEWKKLAQILSKNHSVYIIDLPGCGRSAKPTLKYSNYMYVQLINDFCQDIVVKRQPGYKIDVITSGYSASFALAETVFEPEMFDKILMVNPINPDKMIAGASPNDMLMAKALLLPGIGTFIFNMMTSKYVLRKLFKKRFYYDAARIDNKDVEAFAEAAHLGGTSSKILEASMMSRHLNADMGRVIGLTKANLYLILGSREPDSQDTIEAFKDAGAEFESNFISDTMHFPHMERPEATAFICEHYLKGDK